MEAVVSCGLALFFPVLSWSVVRFAVCLFFFCSRTCAHDTIRPVVHVSNYPLRRSTAGWHFNGIPFPVMRLTCGHDVVKPIEKKTNRCSRNHGQTMIKLRHCQQQAQQQRPSGGSRPGTPAQSAENSVGEEQQLHVRGYEHMEHLAETGRGGSVGMTLSPPPLHVVSVRGADTLGPDTDQKLTQARKQTISPW